MAIADASTTGVPPGGGTPGQVTPPRQARGVRRLGLPALATLTAVATYAAVPRAGSAWEAAPTWAPAALAVGLLLRVPTRWHGVVLANLGVLHALGWVTHGLGWGTAAGFGAAVALAAATTRHRLVVGRVEPRLHDHGDVSRLIGAAALGAGVATAVVGATLEAGGDLTVGVLLSVFTGTAAALVVVVPFFLDHREARPVAGRTERVVAAAITVVTSLVVFSDLVPAPVAFAVMPMFAWHAFRGTLREASWLLLAMAGIATAATWWGIGPMAALQQRWELTGAEVDAVLQLFVLDCGLILLPIAVVVAQHRRAVAVAVTERDSWSRLVQSARGTAIVAIDPSGIVTVVNPGAEVLWGLSTHEMVGLPGDLLCSRAEIERLAAELGCAATLAAVCAAVVERGVPDVTWRLRHTDGSQRVGLLGVCEVPDAPGQRAEHLLTVVDVTEREATRQALSDSLAHEQAAVDRLRELERVKGDFVSTVSHELRTPIASIIGYTEVLVDGDLGDLPDAQRDVVERVDRNSRRLLTLVEDLLTLSEIETSRLRLSPQSHDLRDVLRASYDAMWPLLTGRQLDLDLVLPRRPVVIELDPAQLGRALAKLLDNAVKFTADGGRVTVVLASVGDGAEIVVTDSGVGLGDVSCEAAFERFARGSTAVDRAVQGLGLGLTIVKAVVSLHGGRVSLLPAEGGGTQVRVRLPARVPGASRSLPEQQPRG